MTARRTRKRRIRMALLAAVFAVWMMMVINVNLRYPAVPVEIHYPNEPFLFEGREVTVTNCRLIDGDHTKRLLEQTDPTFYKSLIEQQASEDIRMLLMDLRIKNISDEALESAVRGLSGVIATPVDSLSYSYHDVSEMLNEEALGKDWATLDVGEENTYTIAYYIEHSWMSDKQWARIDDTVLDIILDEYPVEIRLRTK